MNMKSNLTMILAGALVWGRIGVAVAEETNGAERAELYHTPAEKRELPGKTLAEGVSVGGLVEIEAAIGKEAGESVSDIALATFELHIDAEPADWVKGHAVLLWEEDDTEPVDLDEATVTLEASGALPAYLTAGKMYVPFGVFNSHFVSDPLVLELGETRESAILLGYDNTKLALQAAAFNGDMDNGADRADNVVLSAVFAPWKGVHIGASWISDLGESEAMQESIQENLAATPDQRYDEVSGGGAFLSWTPWKLALDVEYIAAMSDFDAGVLGNEALRPSAWNAELAFHSGRGWEVAVKAEGSRDFPDFPEIQYGGVVSIAIAESATFAVEYLHGEYDDEASDRNMATCQLALEF
jgi:hypothetical protein